MHKDEITPEWVRQRSTVIPLAQHMVSEDESLIPGMAYSAIRRILNSGFGDIHVFRNLAQPPLKLDCPTLKFRGRQARNTYGATSYRELANMAPVRVSSRLGKASSRVIGSDGNYDTCGRCKRKGNRGEELVCCDGCEEAFHMRCLPDDAPEVSPGDSKWFCLTTLPCREAHARTE